LRHLPDHLYAATAGHVDVEQDHVRLQLRDRADRLLDRLGLAEHLDQVAELDLDAGSEDPVVVDDHDRGWLAHGPSRSRVSSTSVPLPAPLRISARPRWRSMRPIIDSRIPRRSSGIASGSNPGPRSSTKTLAVPSS